MALPDTTAPHGTLLFAGGQTNALGLSSTGVTASVAFADIDGDGDLDAYSGTFSQGKFLLFLNTGTASSPAFAAPLFNPYGLTNTNSFSNPALVDIDNDGDLDAFVGVLSDETFFFL